MAPGLVYLRQTVTTGSAELTALCQGLYDEGEWFVTAEGEVAANQYENILMPRGTVTIKGLGEWCAPRQEIVLQWRGVDKGSWLVEAVEQRWGVACGARTWETKLLVRGSYL